MDLPGQQSDSNHEPKLPDRAQEALIPNEELNLAVNDIDMGPVWELLVKIKALKNARVTGASVMWTWLATQIQPLQ